MDIALFDFDGTITDREMFVAFLEHAVPRLRLIVGKAALAPLIIGYKLDLLPANTIRAAAVWASLTGTTVVSAERHAATFGTSVLPGVIRTVALERIRWHQARGDTVVVVTGALEVALQPWCKAMGVELVGSVLEERQGRFTGRYSRPQCLREHKVSRVRERYELRSYGAVHVYGDTPDDFALLSVADHGHYRWQTHKPGANNTSKPTPRRGGA
jgi:HAD superfamily hydrolase (TIGR01490 family)